MKLIKTLGIDLDKNTFNFVGMDEHGKVIMRKTLSRKKLLSYITQLNPCLIAMKACSGAHKKYKNMRVLRPSLNAVAKKNGYTGDTHAQPF